MDSDLIRAEYESVRRMFEAWFSGRRCQVDSSYDRASELEFYGDRIGVHTGRMRRSSHVLIYHSGRVLPAQCVSFIQARVNVVLLNGESKAYRPLLARVYWYCRYGESPVAGPMDDTLHTWYVARDKQGAAFTKEEKERPKFVAVHRIISRFVMAPSSVTVVAAKRPASRSKHAVPVKTPVVGGVW